MTEVTATPTATDPTPTQQLGAELVGTFVLVFFGVGTALATGAEVVTTGLAFGLTVLVMAYAVGRISGGHFNPAVTVGAVVSGRMAWSQVPAYVGAQLVGAIGASTVLWIIWQGVPGFSSDGSFGQNSFGDEGGLGFAWWAAFLVEVLTTMVFLLVILAVTDERNEHPALAPLAIGLSLAMIHFTTIPLTGTSVNPARSIGPGLFAGGDAILQLWLFILAPLVGAALAGLLYPAVFGRHSEPVAGSGLRFARRTPAGAVPGYGAPDSYQQQWNQQDWSQQQYPPQAPPPGQPWPQPPQQWHPPQEQQYPTPPPQQSWPQPGDPRPGDPQPGSQPPSQGTGQGTGQGSSQSPDQPGPPA